MATRIRRVRPHNAVTPDDVYLAAGRSLAQVHRFEHNLKGLASLVRSIETAGEASSVEIDFSGFSLGPLIDHVRHLVHIEPGFETDLETARRRRNELCHAYFQDREAELRTEEGRRRLAQELRGWERDFDRVADLTTDLLARLIAALDGTLDRSR